MFEEIFYLKFLSMLPLSQRRNSIFDAEINDHGICRGNHTGQILSRWRRPAVASWVALDLPYWVMRAVLHRNIAMVIEMTSE